MAESEEEKRLHICDEQSLSKQQLPPPTPASHSATWLNGPVVRNSYEKGVAMSHGTPVLSIGAILEGKLSVRKNLNIVKICRDLH